MFLFDDREGKKRIINLDNLVDITAEENRGVLPNEVDVFLVVFTMTGGTRLMVHQGSKDDCVRLVESLWGFLISGRDTFMMSEITG